MGGFESSALKIVGNLYKILAVKSPPAEHMLFAGAAMLWVFNIITQMNIHLAGPRLSP